MSKKDENKIEEQLQEQPQTPAEAVQPEKIDVKDPEEVVAESVAAKKSEELKAEAVERKRFQDEQAKAAEKIRASAIHSQTVSPGGRVPSTDADHSQLAMDAGYHLLKSGVWNIVTTTLDDGTVIQSVVAAK